MIIQYFYKPGYDIKSVISDFIDKSEIHPEWKLDEHSVIFKFFSVGSLNKFMFYDNSGIFYTPRFLAD